MNMRYTGMPMGMWILFAGSFQKQLSGVYGYDAKTAEEITNKAKKRYQEIIGAALTAGIAVLVF